jgi:hypothetical protein
VEGLPLSRVALAVVTALALFACGAPHVTSPQEETAETSDALRGARLRWANHLPYEPRAPGILPFAGSEIRALAAMGGSLYAANGYWRDIRQDDPGVPGPQVLRLDAPFGRWKIDLELGGRISGKHRFQAIGALASFTLATDDDGVALTPPVAILLASTWDRSGGLRVFAKRNGGAWSHRDLVPDAPLHSQVRAFGHHRDPITGKDHLFAGSSPLGIFRGAYDAGTGAIVWTPSEPLVAKHHPAALGHRVLAFAECNGKLYATIGWTLYERQDGPSPRWVEVFGLPDPEPPQKPEHYGLRGATAVRHGGAEALLFGVENKPFSIVRVEPASGFAATTELGVSDYLATRWQTRVGYGIAAYNDMTTYVDPATPACPKVLIGFESTTPDSPIGVGETGKHPYAQFLIRNCNGAYDLRRIRDPKLPDGDLVATRAMLNSPFAADPPGTLYAGGFDAGNMHAHNTAWLFRGAP